MSCCPEARDVRTPSHRWRPSGAGAEALRKSLWPQSRIRVDAKGGVLTAEAENDLPCRLSIALALSLADGTRWTIRGSDETASLVVAALGRAMRLRPGDSGRDLLAVRSLERFRVPQIAKRAGTVVCWLAPLPSPEMQVIQMEQVSSLIASASLPRGGLLLHAALAECRGAGFLMAGPSGIGKSTASRRLPLPHRSLCDDRTLVVRDREGRYWAHPWPTWSQLLNGAPNASWPVEAPVPLRGIFFLRKSATTDRVQPIGRTQATALVMESAIDLTRTIASLAEAGESSGVWESHVAAAKALTTAVPAYSLQVSLPGRFWSEIEQVLPEIGELGTCRLPPDGGRASPGSPRTRVRNSGVSPSDACDGRLRFVCLGRAMSPALTEFEIVEAEPYGPRPVRPGDVVCFRSPDGAEMSMRRVVEVGCEGIRTRGDNVRHDDPWLLQTGDIVGRIVAARRGPRRRAIDGGFSGQVEAVLARIAVPVRTALAHVARRSRNPAAAPAAPFAGILPRRLRPRLVEFNGRCWVVLKLLIRDREIGHYDCLSEVWRIQRPFRWFVDVREFATPARWNQPSFRQATTWSSVSAQGGSDPVSSGCDLPGGK